MSAAKRAKAQKELASHGACPHKDCDSSDAYTEYEDGHGFCYSCNRPFFKEQVKPEQFVKKFVDGYRGISQKSCEKFGIYSYVDDDDNVLFREYTAPDGSKFRRCPKEGMWQQGKYPALAYTWLWNAGSAHYITVVEGEEDAAAFNDIMNTGKTQYPVVALTSAGISKKGRKEIYDYLSKFETVKLAFESDEAGQKAKEILAEMLPNKIRQVPLTKYKDANEYLNNGASDEFKKAWHNAYLWTPDNIFHTEEDVTKILSNEEVESYYRTPFDDLNDVVRGIPLNHVTLLTGMEGIGKTEVLRALEYEALVHNIPIAVLHHEETKKTLYRGLACYEDRKNYRDPDNPGKLTDVKDALNRITNDFKNLYVFEFKHDPDVNTILEQFKYLVHVCGVRYIFIDPINQFDPVDGDQTKVDFLDDLSKKVEKFVQTNPVGVVWTAHVDDEGRTRNSRMISKAASIRIDLKRDLMDEDEYERNNVHFHVTKNRPYSTTGYAGCAMFDTNTFTMEDEAVVYEKDKTEDELPFDKKADKDLDDFISKRVPYKDDPEPDPF